jgi:hypothetical protein
MKQEEHDKKMSQLIAKCWADEGFKQKLLAEPAATLKEEWGLEVPIGMEVRAVENTNKVYHLVLPPKPTTGELSDADLEMVGGGLKYCTIGSYLTGQVYFLRCAGVAPV